MSLTLQMRELKGIKWLVHDQYKRYSWILSKLTLSDSQTWALSFLAGGHCK